MTNVKLPNVMGQTSICEVIQLVLSANSSVQLTKADIDGIILQKYDPYLRQKRTAKTEISRQNSIVACYNAYGLRDCPDVAYINGYFIYSPGGWNGDVSKSKVGEKSNYIFNRNPKFSLEPEKRFTPDNRFDISMKMNSNNGQINDRIKMLLFILGILLALALFFNWGGIREFAIGFAVLAGIGFIGYKIITAKNTGFNLAGRVFIAIVILMAVYGVYLKK